MTFATYPFGYMSKGRDAQPDEKVLAALLRLPGETDAQALERCRTSPLPTPAEAVVRLAKIKAEIKAEQRRASLCADAVTFRTAEIASRRMELAPRRMRVPLAPVRSLLVGPGCTARCYEVNTPHGGVGNSFEVHDHRRPDEGGGGAYGVLRPTFPRLPQVDPIVAARLVQTGIALVLVAEGIWTHAGWLAGGVFAVGLVLLALRIERRAQHLVVVQREARDRSGDEWVASEVKKRFPSAVKR
jgi:hypothetical protein